jgi:hypothetical protein
MGDYNMNIRTFNLSASITAFVLGTTYLFSDTASITANVIGSSGSNNSLTAIMGIIMIIGSIGLFIVSMRSTDNHNIDLERLIRGTKYHEEMHVKQGQIPETEMEEEYLKEQ